jgi:hypothetical protein
MMKIESCGNEALGIMGASHPPSRRFASLRAQPSCKTSVALMRSLDHKKSRDTPSSLVVKNHHLSSLYLEETIRMTGVEAAGFVLGVLPLMISAAEHYEDVFRPFKRYRKFAPELELYQQQLGTQKTIFRNECHLLLATLTNRQTAKEMLREGKHPS